ncbi:MAG: hypothetical protein V4449_03080 [Patescibacteria group bacterium]
MRRVDSKNRLKSTTVKLLIFNKNFKTYDIQCVAEKEIDAITGKIKTEGLQCDHVVDEQEIDKKMKTTGYSRAKYY